MAPPPQAMLATELLAWADKMKPLIERKPPLTPAQIARALGREIDLEFGRLVRTVVDVLPGLQSKSRISKIVARKLGKQG